MIFVEFNVFDVSTKELVWDGPAPGRNASALSRPGLSM